VARPLDVATLGHGSERAAPTGQHHRFFDVSDGALGLALFARGLPEHEVKRRGDHATEIALTLLRSVGWLSRGDLAVIDHAAGPILPTPAAQELGKHRFEYALLLHRGDWHDAGVAVAARRYAAPPMSVAPSGRHTVPANRALCEVEPAEIAISAIHPAETGRGIAVRLLNLSPSVTHACLRPAFGAREAIAVDPLEHEADLPVAFADGIARLTLRPWQIATVLFRT
jgi:alpha-mannosidase